jgi:hypothetical protein
VYDHVLAGGLRHFLINKDQSQNDKKKDEAPVDLGPRKMRSQTNAAQGKKRKRFDDVDMDDDEYFEKLEANAREPSMEVEEDVEEIGAAELVEIEKKQLLKAAGSSLSSLSLSAILTCVSSAPSKQPQAPEHCCPTTQGMPSSLPLPLAALPAHASADYGCERARSAKWEDDGPRTPPT